MSWVFSSTLNPADATILSHQQRIDLSWLVPGQLQRLDWEGGEVLILRRTPEPMRINENVSFPGGLLCASIRFGRSSIDLEYQPFRYDVAGRSFSPYALPLDVPHHTIEGNILTLGVRG